MSEDGGEEAGLRRRPEVAGKQRMHLIPRRRLYPAANLVGRKSELTPDLLTMPGAEHLVRR